MERLGLISVRELDDYVARWPRIYLIDVRPEEEFRVSHIRHAINIPYEEGMKWELPEKKFSVVYCERGSASMAAVRDLMRQGYHAVSVAGGIQEYHGRNLVFSGEA